MFILDRIEDNFAVLEDTDTGERVNAGITLLPEGAEEGDAFFFSGGRYIKDVQFSIERAKKIEKFFADLWEKP